MDIQKDKDLKTSSTNTTPNTTDLNKGIKPLRELTKDDVLKLNKAKITFRKTKTKSGLTMNRIYIDLGHDMLKDIELTYNNRSISTDRFNAILLETNTNIYDAMGKPIDSITRSVPIRFIKGINEENKELNYHSVEIIFKQYLYNVHFFSSDQMRIINKLLENNQIDIKFLDYSYNKKELSDFDEQTKTFDF